MREQRTAHSSYVPALREAPAQVIEVETTWRELPVAPITPPMPYSSHTDRANGFLVATAPLATIAGFVVALVGIIGGKCP